MYVHIYIYPYACMNIHTEVHTLTHTPDIVCIYILCIYIQRLYVYTYNRTHSHTYTGKDILLAVHRMLHTSSRTHTRVDEAYECVLILRIHFHTITQYLFTRFNTHTSTFTSATVPGTHTYVHTYMIHTRANKHKITQLPCT
jgi:hypothetical protein